MCPNKAKREPSVFFLFSDSSSDLCSISRPLERPSGSKDVDNAPLLWLLPRLRLHDCQRLLLWWGCHWFDSRWKRSNSIDLLFVIDIHILACTEYNLVKSLPALRWVPVAGECLSHLWILGNFLHRLLWLHGWHNLPRVKVHLSLYLCICVFVYLYLCFKNSSVFQDNPNCHHGRLLLCHGHHWELYQRSDL